MVAVNYGLLLAGDAVMSGPADIWTGPDRLAS
jgi:hypothetical protein